MFQDGKRYKGCYETMSYVLCRRIHVPRPVCRPATTPGVPQHQYQRGRGTALPGGMIGMEFRRGVSQGIQQAQLAQKLPTIQLVLANSERYLVVNVGQQHPFFSNSSCVGRVLSLNAHGQWMLINISGRKWLAAIEPRHMDQLMDTWGKSGANHETM